MCVGFLMTAIAGLTRPSCTSQHVASLELENAHRSAAQVVGKSSREAKRILATQPVIGEYKVIENPGSILLTSPYRHPNFGRESRVRIQLSLNNQRVISYQVTLRDD